MKLRTLFSGIGAPESALKNLGIEYELVDFCEIDKYAVKSYCAIHGVDESKNLGDISKVWGRDLSYADMLIWGFPCTDISVAGKQAGIVEGETRSGLYYEGLRILKETMPKFSIIENVKNLTGKKFKAEFHQMLTDIEELGYTNYWQVLNAKNYGIPQNRERGFIVSIRNDVDTGFEFPQGFDNGLRLKDFLEDEVDEKFYISQDKVNKIINSAFMQEKTRIQNGNGVCQTLLARDYKDPKCIPIDKSYNNPKPIEHANCITAREDRGISNHQAEGTAVCIPCITPDREEKRQNGRRSKEDGEPMFTLTSQDRHGVLQVGNIVDTGNWNNPQRGRIYSAEGCSPALNTVGGGGLEPKVVTRHTELPCILDDRDKGFGVKTSDICPTQRAERYGIKTVLPNYRIRKLTPKECFRLMGFSDEEFQRCVDAGISNSQLYRQSGNSIVTNVMYYIFKNLLKEVEEC